MEVLGGTGAWPVAGQGCSGYLVSHAQDLVLIDPGYGTMGPFVAAHEPEALTAVLVSHGHPDHCGDLNPLLRARHLGAGADPLPVYAPDGALDAVLGLDPPGLLDGAAVVHVLGEAETIRVGGLTVTTRVLPHHVVNVGMRMETGDGVIAYTGDTGPSEAIVELAQDADVFIAEATFAEQVHPASDGALLSTAWQAGANAAAAGVGCLVLTHLWPGTDPTSVIEAARRHYAGTIEVAVPGLTYTVGR